MFNLKDATMIIQEVTKTELEECLLNKIEATLTNVLLVSPEKYQNHMHILFGGYDYDKREIYEIPVICDWCLKLVKAYPEVLYFLEEEMSGLQNIILCISEIETLDYNSGMKQLSVRIPFELYVEVMRRVATSSLAEKIPDFVNVIDHKIKKFL